MSEDVGIAKAAPQVWWIFVERDHEDPGPDEHIAFGPYLTEYSASVAMEDSILIQGQCEEDCVDCYLVATHPEESPEGAEIVLVDLDNPDHNGLVCKGHESRRGYFIGVTEWCDYHECRR